jgi:replicative DNA helicase
VFRTDADLEAETPDREDRSTPPHSDQAEVAVLGSVLKNPYAVREVVDIVEPRDFYSTRHQAIWKAVQALESEGTPIDYHLLGDKLHQQGTYDAAGGLLYLSEINLATPTSAFITHYAKIVLRASLHRRLISLSQGLAEAAWLDRKSPEDLMAEMEKRMAKLNLRAVEDDGVDMDAATDEALSALDIQIKAFAEHDHTKSEYMAGYKTGLIDLDQALLGMKPGDLIYLAARTSVGKSILAQQIAMHVANHRGAVYFASLEMTRAKLIHRAITMTTGIPRHELARGNLSDQDRAAVERFADRHRQLRMRWDTTSRTVEQIQRRALRWADQIGEPLALVIVDYVQLLRDAAGPRSNRYEDVSLASHNLKEMAGRLGCTVFAPAQVSRDVLKRKSKMPDLSDLRESGDLEQDADIVLALDRDDYHDNTVTDQRATLGVLKARDLAADRGRGTMIRLVWLPKFERYGNAERDPNNVVPFRPRPLLHDDLQAQITDAAPSDEPSTPDGDPLPW